MKGAFKTHQNSVKELDQTVKEVSASTGFFAREAPYLGDLNGGEPAPKRRRKSGQSKRTRRSKPAGGFEMTPVLVGDVK